jgi:hypothetical protein
MDISNSLKLSKTAGAKNLSTARIGTISAYNMYIKSFKAKLLEKSPDEMSRIQLAAIHWRKSRGKPVDCEKQRKRMSADQFISQTKLEPLPCRRSKIL